MDKHKDGEMWNLTLAYFAEEYGRDSEKYINMKRAAKKALNEGEYFEDSPLTEDGRSQDDGTDNCGVYWVQYGYFDGTNKTDADVREYIDEYIRVRPPYSPYDCTGRAFTWMVDWHRNPSGLISYRNHMTLDI